MYALICNAIDSCYYIIGVQSISQSLVVVEGVGLPLNEETTEEVGVVALLVASACACADKGNTPGGTNTPFTSWRMVLHALRSAPTTAPAASPATVRF